MSRLPCWLFQYTVEQYWNEKYSQYYFQNNRRSKFQKVWVLKGTRYFTTTTTQIFIYIYTPYVVCTRTYDSYNDLINVNQIRYKMLYYPDILMLEYENRRKRPRLLPIYIYYNFQYNMIISPYRLMSNMSVSDLSS